MTFDRITIEPTKMRTTPCIRGLRIPVVTVIAQLAARNLGAAHVHHPGLRIRANDSTDLSWRT